MARGVRVWVALAIAACGIVAVAYLPPRGGVSEPVSRFGPRVPQSTPARLRAQALAGQWRDAQAALSLAQHRQRMEPSFARIQAAHEGPTVVVEGPDSIPLAAHRRVAEAMDSAWRHLGLGAAKIAVGVVIELMGRVRVATATTPVVQQGPPAYLLPDSSDRTTCIALIPAGPYWTRVLLRKQPEDPRFSLEQWMTNRLGPCAFYAAHGTPGKPVRWWMARRGYDLSLSPAWADPNFTQLWATWFTDSRGRVYWDLVYRYPFSTVACFGGRPDGCRASVLEDASGGFQDTLPKIVVTEFRGFWRGQRLVPGERFLADVAREVGRDRFQRFWNSTEPVDTTLTEALRMPVGEWTERWERRFVPRLPLGPAAPLSASVLALLLAAAAVGSVALTARRRQVR